MSDLYVINIVVINHGRLPEEMLYPHENPQLDLILTYYFSLAKKMTLRDLHYGQVFIVSNVTQIIHDACLL